MGHRTAGASRLPQEEIGNSPLLAALVEGYESLARLVRIEITSALDPTEFRDNVFLYSMELRRLDTNPAQCEMRGSANANDY